MTVTLRVQGYVFILLLALSACATPRQAAEPSPHYKIGKPYQINGRWYHPRHDPDYDKVGVASWYGDPFHGRLTANGEIFDMNQMTAAHTTLPLPSLAEVQNLENGRTIIVRVNDRGPFADDRIIDLSREAARRLGFERKGLARVRVRYAGPAGLPHQRGAPPPAEPVPAEPALRGPVIARVERPAAEPEAQVVAEVPSDVADVLSEIDEARPLTPGAEELALAEAAAPAPAPGAIGEPAAARKPMFAIRVAALWSLDYLETLRAELAPVGPLRLSRMESESGEIFYRVNMGPFADPAEAARRLEAVREAGYADAALVAITP